MNKTIRIGNREVGDGQPCFIIAKIGINHNGDLAITRRLIDAAVEHGCDAVKFQKRTVDVVYTADELAKPRENPFGPTNGDLKRGLEFGAAQYREIDHYCKQKGILWFASCWDEASVDFIDAFQPPCYKIASASLTDDGLLRHHRQTGRPLILSTGTSTLEQVDHAVEVLGKQDLVLLHTNSTYPSKLEELNLRAMSTLHQRYGIPVGYSGTRAGPGPLRRRHRPGACIIERHITLDRAMWGSDQAASVEPQGFERLVKDIRAVQVALGDGVSGSTTPRFPS